MLSIRGLRIAARTAGSGDPVLLLNGMSRPMASWSHFTDALRGRTVITFDGPGVGASETPVVPYSMPMLADVAVRVLDAVGIEKADVVGYSHGGAVAQQIAIGHPTRVNRLVLLSTSCGLGAVPGRGRDATRIMLDPSRATRWPRPDPLGLLWQIAAISTWTSIPVLGCIDAPTLVVCGDYDTAVPPANSRILAARIPDARLVTIPAGHDLQLPVPAATVAELVTQFLDSETARSGNSASDGRVSSIDGCYPKARAISPPGGYVGPTREPCPIRPSTQRPASSGAMTAGSIRRTP